MTLTFDKHWYDGEYFTYWDIYDTKNRYFGTLHYDDEDEPHAWVLVDTSANTPRTFRSNHKYVLNLNDAIDWAYDFYKHKYDQIMRPARTRQVLA